MSRSPSEGLNPTPPDGNMIRAAWLGRYDTAPERKTFRRVVLSCDPAGKAGIHNDYTTITVVGVREKSLHVLQISRGHWTVKHSCAAARGECGAPCGDLLISRRREYPVPRGGVGMLQRSAMKILGRVTSPSLIYCFERPHSRSRTAAMSIPEHVTSGRSETPGRMVN
jgi:hypothetical protein